MRVMILNGTTAPGKGNGTGDVGSDTRTWLSAALSNQDTCMEGFQGTSGLVKSLVAGKLITCYCNLTKSWLEEFIYVFW